MRPTMHRAWREGDALRLLTDLAEVPSKTTDVAAAATRIRELLAGFGVQFAGVYLVYPEGDIVRVTGTLSPDAERISAAQPVVARLRERLAPLRVPIAEHPCPSCVAKLEARGIRTVVLLPLVLGDRFTGFLTASNPGDENGLSEIPDEFLVVLGRVASVALDQVRLLAAARARAERDRLLLEAARFASSSRDLDATLARYADVLALTAQARRTSIALRDPGTDGFFRHRAIVVPPGEDPEALRALPIRDVGMIRVATESRRPHVYSADQIITPAVSDYFRSCGDGHFVVLPLVAQDAVVGVAFVSRTTPIDPETSVLLEAIAHEVAAAIGAAAEREAARHTAEREVLEARLRASLRDSFDLGTILANAVESLGRLLRADRAQILLPHPEKRDLLLLGHCWRRHSGIPDPTGMTFKNVSTVRPGETSAPLVVADFDRDERLAGQKELRPASGTAFVFVRFDRGFERGGLSVCMAHTPRRWTDEEVRSIAAVAEHCQIAIARAELYENWRRRADELELTVASMSDGVVLVNDTLEIVRMNPAARALLWNRHDAPPPGTVEGWNPHVVVLDWEGRVIPQERWPIVRAVVHGEVSNALELVFRFSDTGRERSLVVNASPLRDTEGRLRGAVIVLRDVTEQRAARGSAERTEKLRVVGELAASVAHDLNNTLAAVLGRAEMIATATESTQTRADAELIAQAARDASVVLTRLMRLSQKGHAAAPRTQVDLGEVARDAVELTRPRWSLDAGRAGRRIALEVSTEPAVLVRGLATELREVLTNLILNSVDALPAGGTIKVSAGREGAQAFFAVEDDGTGMPEEVLRHACEPFFTTKGDLGTGLGLSISAAIMAGHGGRLDIRSTPGSGTAIRGWLPAAEEDPTPRGPVNVPRTHRVLVVDDDPRVRSVLADLLRAEGHAVQVAGSGEEALDTIDAAVSGFDLLVTDVAMPGMSGWVLAEEVRRRHARVAIVLVSGWSASASRDELATLRATFVMKPFRTHEFHAAVALAVQLATRPQDEARPRAPERA